MQIVVSADGGCIVNGNRKTFLQIGTGSIGKVIHYHKMVITSVLRIVTSLFRPELSCASLVTLCKDMSNILVVSSVDHAGL